jgi:hypothetical protein
VEVVDQTMSDTGEAASFFEALFNNGFFSCSLFSLNEAEAISMAFFYKIFFSHADFLV